MSSRSSQALNARGIHGNVNLTGPGYHGETRKWESQGQLCTSESPFRQPWGEGLASRPSYVFIQLGGDGSHSKTMAMRHGPSGVDLRVTKKIRSVGLGE